MLLMVWMVQENLDSEMAMERGSKDGHGRPLAGISGLN